MRNGKMRKLQVLVAEVNGEVSVSYDFVDENNKPIGYVDIATFKWHLDHLRATLQHMEREMNL